jgi:hypothetical protein
MARRCRDLTPTVFAGPPRSIFRALDAASRVATTRRSFPAGCVRARALRGGRTDRPRAVRGATCREYSTVQLSSVESRERRVERASSRESIESREHRVERASSRESIESRERRVERASSRESVELGECIGRRPCDHERFPLHRHSPGAVTRARAGGGRARERVASALGAGPCILEHGSRSARELTTG